MIVLIYEFIQEMGTWFTITHKMQDVAKEIDEKQLLDKDERKNLKELARGWENGKYDEDPKYVFNELLNIINKERNVNS